MSSQEASRTTEKLCVQDHVAVNLCLILMEKVYQGKIKSELVGKSYHTPQPLPDNLQTVKTNKCVGVCGGQCKQSSAGRCNRNLKLILVAIQPYEALYHQMWPLYKI